jgi:hypothetical protein
MRLQYLGGVCWQRNLMRQAVFGALGPDPPQVLIEFEFGPPHRGDFLAALPGENEQADDRAIVITFARA